MVKTLEKIKVSGIFHVVNDQKSMDFSLELSQFINYFCFYRMKTAIVGPVTSESGNATRIQALRVNSLRASIRGEAFRSSLLSRQRSQQVTASATKMAAKRSFTINAA